MVRLILHRLLISIPLILVVTFITFLLAALAPGDLARAAVGQGASQEAYEAMRAQLGLDRPVFVQYVDWVFSAARGDLGQSVLTGQSVVEALNSRLPVTLSIVLGVMIVCIVVGVLLGTSSAVVGGWFGRLIDGLSMGGLVFPSFWVALVLISVFAVSLRWLPASGYVQLADNPGAWFLGLVLPVTAVAIGAVTTMAKQTRDSVSDILSKDFVRSLRAVGLSERRIVLKHVMRNAALPLITLLGLILINAISGTVFVEQIFSLPGLGSLAVTAALQGNIPVLQGVTLYVTIFTVVVNLLVDISYGWLNPKVRTS